MLYLLLLMPASLQDVKTLASQAMEAEKAGDYQRAKSFLDQAIKQDARIADLFSLRGGVHFKLGLSKESLADFDEQIKLRPSAASAHWRRGLTLFYAEKYTDGVAQFITSDKSEPEDVENAVWHLLCNAKVKGLEAARKEILLVKQDSRVPMMAVYNLFAGKSTIAQVQAAAEAGTMSDVERRSSRFYACLYCGLYEEMAGHTQEAREWISKAVKDYSIDHYMMDVARVHLKVKK